MAQPIRAGTDRRDASQIAGVAGVKDSPLKQELLLAIAPVLNAGIYIFNSAML